MHSLTSNIPPNIPLSSRKSSNKTQSGLRIRASQILSSDKHKTQHHPHQRQHQQSSIPVLDSISTLVQLRLHNNSHNQQPQFIDWNSLDAAAHATPISSPKEEISLQWRQLVNSNYDFDQLIDPLQPWLRREIIKYGEFAQATYDAFDFDSHSEYCGSCRYGIHNLFNKLGLGNHGYRATKHIYAMSHVDVPQWLQRSNLVDTWSKDSNWMGYVAVSDDEESRRIGRRDILVAWRGTVAPSEWFEDLQGKLEPIEKDSNEVKVEHGFLDIYRSKNESTRYNKSSASEQVMAEIRRLVSVYKAKGEEVGVTITGHSLGGALALLNAYELAASAIPNVAINVVSFGAPRVGNIAFRDKLHEQGVKTLRVRVKQDLVPRMPGILFNEESLQMFEEITGTLDWVYTHVGAELRLDAVESPYLKTGLNLVGWHSLETYLHLIDGHVSGNSRFRKEARRDVALVNKSCGMLIDDLRIPACWYQLENKGLVKNSYGRWVKPRRNPEDIPTQCSHCVEDHHDHCVEAVTCLA
ncbi:hypothetical protein Sjap_008336 [Stephania japonica]|uniref:Fungal lipase-type domain-containing protein n=1 Tax=Stephania japonica TaxID=461633 RepID=A0AAP0JPF4_9MAGN